MPKTPAQAVLDRVVALGLMPLLRPEGFKKAGRNFRSHRERCVLVVNIQSSAWSFSEELKFTINLGVFYPEVHALKTFLGWSPSAAGPTECECQFRSRIGILMPAGRDHWWTLRADDDPTSTAGEAEEAVRRFGLPWLGSRSTWDAARLIAEPIDAVAFAIASGDMVAAERHLKPLLRASTRADELRAWGRGLGLKV